MQLNTEVSSASKKRQKKSDRNPGINLNVPHSLDSQVTFSWDSSTQIKGQALRRKSKATNVTQPNVSSVQANTNKIIFKKQNKNVESNNKNSSVNQTQSNIESAHIKRKHKKDKQKAVLNKSIESAASEIKNDEKVSSKSFGLFSGKQKSVYVKTQSGKSLSEKVFADTGSKFTSLPIHKYLVSNLEKNQLTDLTTVQEKAIPVILSEKDVLVRSQTGSGKTLAYAVPILNALLHVTPKLQRQDGVQAIIVVPTRELALQTHEWFSKINTFQWIVVGHLCGGENRKTEKDRLRKGIHILIGTPGRLLDHVLHTSALKLNNTRCLILDEADRLLDMGFRKDIISLVEELDKAKANSEYDPMAMLKNTRKNFSTEESQEAEEDDKSNVNDEETAVPQDSSSQNRRQTILLSATLNKGVSELADFVMKDHVFVDALENSNSLGSSNIQNNSLVIPDTVKQEFILTYIKHRLFTLSALIISKIKKGSKLFIFMASTQMVEYHYELFTQCLVKMPVNRGKLKAGNVVLFDANNDDSEDENEEEEVVLNTEFFKLHGSMDQKMRKEVFNGFRAAKTGVLLCTDVVARGIDVPSADCIVQYTAPQTDEDYLHRVGRTGRAGKSGSAIIFLTHEEQDYIPHLAKQRVFLKQQNSDNILQVLCKIMEEPDNERAAEALQRRYEAVVEKDKQLQLSACLAYSTWSRFYNSYPSKLRSIFDFKKINLGHYASSFALKSTPSQIARIVRGHVSNTEHPTLNQKLANHATESTSAPQRKNPRQKRAIALITSEFDSGLGPTKKKKKKQIEDQ